MVRSVDGGLTGSVRRSGQSDRLERMLQSVKRMEMRRSRILGDVEE